jgi:HPt (histidine-containing phosphotransfer) domain-containing protein
VTPSIPTETPAINYDELVTRMMGSAEMAERMLAKFVSAAEIECDQLESLVRLGNAQDIASLAHRHKGTARTMAAARVADIAQQIEQSAKSEATLELLQMVEQLRSSHQEVRDVLSSLPHQANEN